MVDVTIIDSVPIAIENFDDLWKCEHERENKRNNASGLLMLALNAYLIDAYLDKYNESQRRLKNIAIREQRMVIRIKDHYMNVTFKQKIKAIEDALSMPIPSKTISQSDFDESRLVNRAIKQKDTLLNSNSSCGDYGCDNSIYIAGKMAMADSSYSRRQYNLRRVERRTELKRRVIQRSHASSFESPQGIFQLMNSASNIYSTIFQNAQTNLSGAVSSFGYGLKQLA